jgi:L-asparaginase II
MAECPPVLVEVRRGPLIESRHRGSVAVVDASGQVRASLGDIRQQIFLRSMAKPVQALPVIESGAADRFGLSEAELAAMCGSLSGEDHQAETVARILGRVGLTEASLRCGLQRPVHRPTAERLEKTGEKNSPLRHNCAGKHAAMLLLCTHHGWPTEDYPNPEHPVQRLILARLAEFCGLPQAEVAVGVDGCGVPVFGVPLKSAALAYARLAAGGEPSVARLMAACLKHPEMIGGEGRICTEAMLAVPNLLAKTGAEGGYGLALTAQGLGVALKVEDGAHRAVHCAVVEVLAQLGVLDAAGEARLTRWRRQSVKGFSGEVVGEVAPVFRLLL